MKYTENLIAWKALIVTTHTGSVSQTAMMIDLDLPKTSRLLSGLEQELGIPLFDKTHRPITPTPQCAELVKTIEPHLDVFLKAQKLVQGDEGALTIRFSAPIELSQDFFSHQLIHYSSEHPDIQFSIFPEVTPEQLSSGEVDVAIFNERPIDSTGLIARPYNMSSTVAFASPGYLAYYGEPRTPADLKDHSGLLLQTININSASTLYRNGIAFSPLKWRTVFHTHDQLTLKRLLLEQQGITVDLYHGHVIKEIRTGQIVPILRGWRREPWNMFIVTRQETELKSTRMREFVRWFACYAETSMRAITAEADLAVSDAYDRREKERGSCAGG